MLSGGPTNDVGCPSEHEATYAYSNLGQLASVIDWHGRPTSFSYDIASRPTTITRSNPVGGSTTITRSNPVGGSTTNFAWAVAGMGYILAESGASANEFVWRGGLIAQLMTSGGTPTYPHADGLGSLRLLTDGAGNVAGSKQYDAYGASRGSSGTTLSFGFTGEYQDSKCGLIYLRARFYDPTTGRFISQDPIPRGLR